MELGGNVVLVTGGASGIGLALAERFLKAGSEVVLCGRRKEKLEEARAKHPAFKVKVCDVARPEEREALLAWATREFPRLNVLVNNAGIQRALKLGEAEPWEATREELAINLDAPIHLSRLFAAHLAAQKNGTIVNVTSGLAFAPLARVPVYSATKAALHSFTLSLRHQLKPLGVRVVEIAPPAVDTDLGGPGLHKFGVPVDAFADAVMARVAKGELEVGYQFSEANRTASRDQLDATFARMNGKD